jgi:hypothetical protein
MDSLRFQAILLTYDILNDDDDELRDIGATTVTSIRCAADVNFRAKDMVPLVASQKLAAHLVKNYNHSAQLCREAVVRMTGSLCSLEPPFLAPKVSKALDLALKEDTSLFVIEKQNLFVDEVRETILWSQVLKGLSMKTVSKNIADSLSEWTTDGLGTLIKKAEEAEDWSLGWCSKSEVFIVFMRILCASEVLMCWRLKTKKVGVKGTEIRGLLIKLLAAGLRNGLHEVLLDRIETVVMQSALARLNLVGSYLSRAERDLVEVDYSS